jgi:hypothetical protein
VCGVEWELEVKLDVPGFDPAVVMPVVVLQPTALLRAGVVNVGQYALWPVADGASDGIAATIGLDPVPLCIGAPFSGRIDLDLPERLSLQEVRLELRVHARATEPSGKEEEITLWSGRVGEQGELGGRVETIEFSDAVPERWLPSTRLRHGRTDGSFRVVLARAWARDPNLVRDVAICSTLEL